ncbi:prolyl oligopeptidase family serine peptidase [Cesiribacter andamanensis]|uniref:prolyl oligopeptidase n=1 Tax=Cesiribacter andamanensis AMV16 TaxID=1279009 RepID=M7MZC7_9BACT|nr:prolyl oligopeptidase family serine peptidase [Cesiribacter andamanensis]EMR01768.1 Prolyl endopeptidase precursor [Cesiribacter andamanensis AMV16]
MKSTLVYGAAALGLMAACTSTPQESPETARATVPPYPTTAKVDTIDSYFGQQVPDPYRWLEDDRSQETGQWVAAQNEVTQGYLEQIPYREQIQERLTQIWNYAKTGAPFKEGNSWYVYRNNGLQNQYVLYRMDQPGQAGEVFLDPNTFSQDGTTSLGGLNFSKDGTYVAYSISEGGSDWRTIRIMEAATKKLLQDEVRWSKFSGMSWAGDGFYYSAYDAPKEGDALKGKNEYHKVYYHKLGTPQSQDQLVYEDKQHPLRNFYAQTTEDERFLIIGGSEGTSGNNVLVRDLSKPNSPFITVVEDFKKDHNVVDTDGNSLLLLTTLNAPNKRLVRVDLSKPQPQHWVDVIPESDRLLEGVGTAGGKLFASYMQDATTRMYQYDRQGQLEREIELPGIGSAGGFGGKKEDQELYYTFTSFTSPGTIYKYDIRTGQSSLFEAPKIDFDFTQYETKQVFYTSKDGTKVPMFIVHKKGLKLDGSNPTYLYSYGGFDISMRPGFSIARMAWLEQGGIYAQPSIRGGGEYGQAWHEGGMKTQKQNVFDDFIGAAEYLIKEGYTSKEKLAINGGSNGGLLVGAVMTQRPDLFQVALPAVGVLDMLRYHKFTIGWAWAVEYGSSEESQEMFRYLLAYSPLHNIKEGVTYPATMVTTADHDDRVVPAHSFKFISALQERGAPGNPYLIRIETKAGHGAGKPTAMQIAEWADRYAFTWHNMGVTPDFEQLKKKDVQLQ